MKFSKFLTADQIAVLSGGLSAEEFVRYREAIADAHSWKGRLRLVFRRWFPPKSWVWTCANCGKRTADPGDKKYGLPSYCSRQKCVSVAADHIERQLDAMTANFPRTV